MRTPAQIHHLLFAGASILDQLIALIGENGFLWLDDPANRDPALGGLNPNFLANSDDPTAGVWIQTGVAIGLGVSDPDGGTNAWTVTTNNVTAQEYVQQPLTVLPNEIASSIVDLRRRTLPGSGIDATFRLRDQTAPGNLTLTLAIISGPGTVSASPGSAPKITDLSSSQYTKVRITTSIAIVAGNDVRYRIHPGTDTVQEAAAVDVFRPIFQVGAGEGKQFVTGVTPGGRVAKWRDLIQGLDVDQVTAGNQPYVRFNPLTLRHEVVFDGVDDFLGTGTITAVTQPFLSYGLAEDTSGDEDQRQVLNGGASVPLLEVFNVIQTNAGVTLSSAAAWSPIALVSSLLDGGSSELRRNSISIGTGNAGTNSLTRVQISSSAFEWGGPIQCIAIDTTGDTAKRAEIESLIDQYFNRIITDPAIFILTDEVDDLLTDEVGDRLTT